MLDKRAQRIALAAVLALGLGIRLPFVVAGYHVSQDLAVFLGWGRFIQTHGLTNAYQLPQVNYPPLLLYLYSSALGIQTDMQQVDAGPGRDDRLATLLIQ